MISALFSSLLLSVITLPGVIGDELRVRAHLDTHNVRLGDPMILAIDFIGSADFTRLHPPALSREVNREFWKIDDESAKTDTIDGARRLTYRMRPLKEGVLEFPALEFSFVKFDGTENPTNREIIATHALPVHVKPGAQIALAQDAAETENWLMPDGLHFATKRVLSADEQFRWEKACRAPSAAQFANFDFPEARLNEAACHVLDGNWAKALRLYSALEWQLGQTREIERGILAALSRKFNSSSVELPVWRVTFREILRFAWLGRLLAIVGILAIFAIFFWLCGKIIRHFVSLTILFFALPLFAQTSAEDALERMNRMMQQSMNNMMSMNFSFNGVNHARPEIKASLAKTKESPRVGEEFEFILSLEAPKQTTLENLRLNFSRNTFLGTMTGEIETLENGTTKNPSNVVRRLSIPVRFDLPFTGPIEMIVSGMAQTRQETNENNQRRSFSFAHSFSARTPPIHVHIEPLPGENQPRDFSGAVGTNFELTQHVDCTRVETNDVVVVMCSLAYRGFVPSDNITHLLANNPQKGQLVWRRYFVARGEDETPPLEFVVFDADEKKYRRLFAKGQKLTYVASAADETTRVLALDARDEQSRERLTTLYFAPRANAPRVATIPTSALHACTKMETCGAWTRLESATHAGWILTDDLKEEKMK